jgi:hypothetical protein
VLHVASIAPARLMRKAMPGDAEREHPGPG